MGAPEMAGRIRATLEAGLPWLVCVEGGEVLGYAYASPWKRRAAYRHAVETTVYLRADACGRGLGLRLYEALLPALEALGKHAVIAGVAQPNPASVALHEKLGFRKIGQFQQVGWKLGRWVDVGYWELVLPVKGTGAAATRPPPA